MIPASQIERAAVAITRLAVELETRPPAVVAAWRFRRRVALAADGYDERLTLAAIVGLPIPRGRLASAPWLSEARERFDALIAAENSPDTLSFVARVRDGVGRERSWIEVVAEARAAWSAGGGAWAALEEGTVQALAVGLEIPAPTGVGTAPSRAAPAAIVAAMERQARGALDELEDIAVARDAALRSLAPAPKAEIEKDALFGRRARSRVRSVRSDSRAVAAIDTVLARPRTAADIAKALGDDVSTASAARLCDRLTRWGALIAVVGTGGRRVYLTPDLSDVALPERFEPSLDAARPLEPLAPSSPRPPPLNPIVVDEVAAAAAALDRLLKRQRLVGGSDDD